MMHQNQIKPSLRKREEKYQKPTSQSHSSSPSFPNSHQAINFCHTKLRPKYFAHLKKESMMPAHYGVIFSLILPLFLAAVITSTEASLSLSLTHANGSAALADKGEVGPLVPLIEAGNIKTLVVINETRRRLGSFQICALCTCCGGAKGLCLPSPCCYAINCNIPNRPFGFCSFTPKTCNCLRCHL